MTLEMLIAWHQQRAGEHFMTIARATHMPESKLQSLSAMAHFHTLRPLQTL
jgi:hypothetical protein